MERETLIFYKDIVPMGRRDNLNDTLTVIQSSEWSLNPSVL